MKFAASLIAATMVALAHAKVAFTSTDFKVTEGKPFTLQWTGNNGPVDIVFVAGPDEKSLVPVKPVTSGASGTTFTFTPSDLPSGTYAFRITDTTDPSNPNFSVPFQYSGTGSLSSSGVSMTSTARSTSTSVMSTTTSSATSSSTTTTSSHSSSSTSTRTSTSTTSASTSRPTNTNDSPKHKSPLALVLLTVAALAYFS